MSKIRTKLFIVLLALFAFTAITSAQQVNEDINPVIEQGVNTAKSGIEYWNTEADISLRFEIPADNSLNQVHKWSAELTHQLNLAKQLAEKNASLNSYSKYLKLAYKTLAMLKDLNADLKLPQLKALISALETAIKIAEKIISIFN